jgi:hypothetical protein
VGEHGLAQVVNHLCTTSAKTSKKPFGTCKNILTHPLLLLIFLKKNKIKLILKGVTRDT